MFFKGRCVIVRSLAVSETVSGQLCHPVFCAFSFRKTLQIDGPYDEAFYQKLLDLSTEDDGTVAFALTKVGGPFWKHCVLLRFFTLAWGFPKTCGFPLPVPGG